MHRWFRRPVVWMVAAEVVVVGALVALAWHEVTVAGQGSAPLILPATSAPEDTSAPDAPEDALSPPDPSSVPLLPGLNVDPAFWRQRLAGLNGAEAEFEALEWRIIHSAMEAVRRYVDTVVVPAVERSEKAAPALS